MKTLFAVTVSLAALMLVAPVGSARADGAGGTRAERPLEGTHVPQAEVCSAVKSLGERVDRIEHRRLEAKYVDQEAAEAASRNYETAKYICAHPGVTVEEAMKAVALEDVRQLVGQALGPKAADEAVAALVAPPRVQSGGGSGSAMDKAKLDALLRSGEAKRSDQ